MSELRAPDPTLSAFDNDAFVEDRGDGTPLAHRWGVDLLECGADPTGTLGMRPRDARWFAVPCRECFPDAPPPGHRVAVPDEHEGPCIGGDYCGRVTNGWFASGSHGPGWYCGWCEALPDGRPDPDLSWQVRLPQ